MMNAYAMADLIEDQRGRAEQAAADREKWIDEETERLLALFPDHPEDFRSIHLHDEVRSMTYGEAAKELYATFAYDLANHQAQRNFQLHALGWK
jgi:hypothetical protein